MGNKRKEAVSRYSGGEADTAPERSLHREVTLSHSQLTSVKHTCSKCVHRGCSLVC